MALRSRRTSSVSGSTKAQPRCDSDGLEKNGDFRNSFQYALRSYARDTDPAQPNPYPRECWPSAEDFRVILYAAGQYSVEGGARLLDRIPDAALRLFAEIEFTAGSVGLAQIGGITREKPRGNQ